MDVQARDHLAIADRGSDQERGVHPNTSRHYDAAIAIYSL